MCLQLRHYRYNTIPNKKKHCTNSKDLVLLSLLIKCVVEELDSLHIHITVKPVFIGFGVLFSYFTDVFNWRSSFLMHNGAFTISPRTLLEAHGQLIMFFQIILYQIKLSFMLYPISHISSTDLKKNALIFQVSKDRWQNTISLLSGPALREAFQLQDSAKVDKRQYYCWKRVLGNL